jgi:hypothetical protein
VKTDRKEGGMNYENMLANEKCVKFCIMSMNMNGLCFFKLSASQCYGSLLVLLTRSSNCVYSLLLLYTQIAIYAHNLLPCSNYIKFIPVISFLSFNPVYFTLTFSRLTHSILYERNHFAQNIFGIWNKVSTGMSQ